MNDSINNMKPLVIIFSNNNKTVANIINRGMQGVKPGAISFERYSLQSYNDFEKKMKQIIEKFSDRRIFLLFDYSGFDEGVKSHPYYKRLSASDNITIGFFGHKSLESSIQECLAPEAQEQELSDIRPDMPSQIVGGASEQSQSYQDLNNVVQDLKTIADNFNAFLKDKTVERGIQSQLRNDIAEISQKLSDLKRIEKQWISAISDFIDSLTATALNFDLDEEERSAAANHIESLLEYLEPLRFERIAPQIGEEWKKESGITASYPENKVVDREKTLIIREILEYGYKYGDAIVKKAKAIVDNPSEDFVAESQNEIQINEGEMTNWEMRTSELEGSQPENMSQYESQNEIQIDEGETTNSEMRASEPEGSQPENMFPSENQNENFY